MGLTHHGLLQAFIQRSKTESGHPLSIQQIHQQYLHRRLFCLIASTLGLGVSSLGQSEATIRPSPLLRLHQKHHRNMTISQRQIDAMKTKHTIVYGREQLQKLDQNQCSQFVIISSPNDGWKGLTGVPAVLLVVLCVLQWGPRGLGFLSCWSISSLCDYV